MTATTTPARTAQRERRQPPSPAPLPAPGGPAPSLAWPRSLAAWAALGRRMAAYLPGWARDWRFWLVFAVGAALRLVAIGRTPFDSDDALLFLEAGRAARDHLMPGTGIYSSLLALNPPIYTYLLLPFAFHPLGMALFTALANVVAVAGLYLFAARHFGRSAALVAGLFFATAPYDTWMSEFVWQQTIVIPLLLAALALAYEGAVRGRRWWLVPHAALLAIAIQVYPLALAFLPLTVLAMALAWRSLRPGNLALVVLVCEVLFLPTMIFELASGGYDLPIYAHWLAAPKQTDLAGFAALAQSLGPQASDFFGPNTWYGGIAPGFAWLTTAIVALGCIATAWLALWLLASLAAAVFSAVRGRQFLPLRARLTGRTWRARLLLLPFPLALLAATTRHSTPVYVHYLFVITPLIYLTIGVFLTTFPVELARWIAWGIARIHAGWVRLSVSRLNTRGSIRRTGRKPAARLGGWLTASANGLAGFTGAALLTTQGCVTGILILTVVLGQASASSSGHISTANFARAFASVDAIALRDHAHQVFIAADPADPYLALYWAERQNALAPPRGPLWTAYVANDCALLPAASERALVLATAATGPALLSAIAAPGVRFVQRIPMARDAAYTLYELPAAAASNTAQLATVNGELRLTTTALAPGSGPSGQTLYTHWTVLASTPPGPAVAQYHFHVLFNTPGGVARDAWATCAPDIWTAGDGLSIAVPVPADIAAHPGWTAQVIVSRDTHTWYRPHLGALVLETAKELVGGYVVLPLGTRQGPGLAAPTQEDLASAAIPLPLAG